MIEVVGNITLTPRQPNWTGYFARIEHTIPPLRLSWTIVPSEGRRRPISSFFVWSWWDWVVTTAVQENEETRQNERVSSRKQSRKHNKQSTEATGALSNFPQAYRLLHGEKWAFSNSSAISQATRASGDVAPNFRVASRASCMACSWGIFCVSPVLSLSSAGKDRILVTDNLLLSVQCETGATTNATLSRSIRSTKTINESMSLYMMIVGKCVSLNDAVLWMWCEWMNAMNENDDGACCDVTVWQCDVTFKISYPKFPLHNKKFGVFAPNENGAVSYTHLTLPTKA